MAQNITVPSQEYLPGNYSVDLNQLPGNSEGARITFTRENWPVGECSKINVYMSRNNGVTWQHVMGATLSGGQILNKDGSVALTSSMLFTWPGEYLPNGDRIKLRGSDVRIIAEVFQVMSTAITIQSITNTAG